MEKHMEEYCKLLKEEIKPIKLGNNNKVGKCGMCGLKFDFLYPQKVGSVEFHICQSCKEIMDL